MPRTLGITAFMSIVLVSFGMWVYLGRHIPLRGFAFLCLLTAAYIGIGLVLFKIFAEKLKQDRRFQILLELVLGAVFVAAFYLFAVYVSPGMK